MTRPSPLWRAIIWTERFLPAPPAPPAEPSLAAKRRAAFVSQLVLLAVAVPAALRHRREMGSLVSLNHVALEQVVLLLAACVIVAAVGFGVKAWRDARGAR